MASPDSSIGKVSETAAAIPTSVAPKPDLIGSGRFGGKVEPDLRYVLGARRVPAITVFLDLGHALFGSTKKALPEYPVQKR